MMTDDMPDPEVAKRRALFADLVARQDKGYTVAAARAQIGKLHALTPAAVRAIEDEGIEKEWSRSGTTDEGCRPRPFLGNICAGGHQFKAMIREARFSDADLDQPGGIGPP